MGNNFFNDSNKAYSENLNDGILVGNAFDWTISIGLPSDTDGVFPSSSDVVMAKVADVSITPNSNLSIGSTISNSSGSSQVYRLTVYPNFNRFGGFKSISLTADSGVTFYIANKGGTSPIANNLDYDDLGNVPELKVLKEYDIVVTIPNNGSVTGLSFVFQSSSASVSGSIEQSNVTGLTTALSGKVDTVSGKGLSKNDFTDAYKLKLDDVNTWEDLGIPGLQGAECKLEVNEIMRLAHFTFKYKAQLYDSNIYIPIFTDTYNLNLNDYMPDADEHYAVCHGANGYRIATIKKSDDDTKRFMIHTDATDRQVTYMIDTIWKY